MLDSNENRAFSLMRIVFVGNIEQRSKEDAAADETFHSITGEVKGNGIQKVLHGCVPPEK